MSENTEEKWGDERHVENAREVAEFGRDKRVGGMCR
jgi:hypothetical protein